MRTIRNLVLVVLVFFTFIPLGIHADQDKWGDLQTCKSELEQFFAEQLDPIKENFEPAEYRVVVGDGDAMMLEIFARTVPDAYLVGYDPVGGARARDFVTPEIFARLQRVAFERVATLQCPYPYPKGLFADPASGLSMKQLMGYIQFFWGYKKDTEYMKVFQDEFDRRFREVIDPIAREKTLANTFLRYAVWTYDQYADTGYTLLNVIVDVYAELWDGNGSTHKEVESRVERGVMDPMLRKRFVFQVQADLSRPWEDIEKDLKDRAERAVTAVAAYVKALE